jgi:inosose dehydratase
MEADWAEKRGSLYGCGMSVITLGDGVIDLPPIVKALQEVGFDGATTLEIAGPYNVKGSLHG